MAERFKQRDLLKRLEEVYSSVGCPVLFIRKNRSPFYFNAAAMLYYPMLCKNGLVPYVAEEKFPSEGLITLEGNDRSPFERYVLSPVARSGPSVYRVQILNDALSEKRLKQMFQRDFFFERSCASAQKQLRSLSGALTRLKKTGTDVSAAERAVASLKQTVGNMKESISGVFPDDDTCFDPAPILRVVSDRLFGFSFSDKRGSSPVIFADKINFLRAVLLASRYLLERTFCSGGIRCVFRCEGEKTLISVERTLVSSPAFIPDAVLAACEQVAAGCGGDVTLSFSEKNAEIRISFNGFLCSPSDFILSDEDIWQVCEDCEDLFAALTQDHLFVK